MATFKYLLYINLASILVTIWLYNLALTGDFDLLKPERMSPLVRNNPLITYSSKFFGTSGTVEELFTIGSNVSVETKETNIEEIGVDTNKAFYTDPTYYFFNVFSVISSVILVVLSLAGGGPILLLLTIQAPVFIVFVFGIFWGLIVIEAIISLFRG